MDSLKYCLVWAAALCYVVVAANTEGEKVIGTFSKTTARGPLVQGTVSVLWDGSLKIKDYKMPEQGKLTWQVLYIFQCKMTCCNKSCSQFFGFFSFEVINHDKIGILLNKSTVRVTNLNL